MAILFSCPGCGSRMQAPETLAGQKARCPSCQLVVEVPQQVLEAEPAPAYPPPRRPSVPPLPPGVKPQVFSSFQDEPEPAEGDRRPCPMCGEMIAAQAVKCRFCGEVFDPALRRRGGSRGEMQQMHSLMNGAGGLWIFLGVLALLGILALAGGAGGRGGGLGGGRIPEELLFIAGLVAMCWLVFGICTCLKQMWAVYAGLVLSYITVALNVINLLGSLGAGAGPQLCGVIFVLCLVVAGIVQAHRIISMSGQMNRRY